MPCYRCGARETDPDRGASPWRRAVRGEAQVLVCPECQESSSWLADVDACPVCGSSSLLRRLGRTVCAHCDGWRSGDHLGRDARIGHLIAGPEAPHTSSPPEEASEVELSREVAEAIDRVLGRDRSVTAW